MASISGTTNNLSSTLQGYGGMASGIDRDSIIEQMTLGTTTKISNVKKEKTELQWKQEAYQSLSDKVLDLQDNYFTYSSEKNLKSASVFAANLITAIGNEDSTKYISASGTSSMVEYLSILGVKQTATSATVMSGVKAGDGTITTKINVADLLTGQSAKTSNLRGTNLQFGSYNQNGSWNSAATFNFASSYTKKYNYTKLYDEDGTTFIGFKRTALGETESVNIDYIENPDKDYTDVSHPEALVQQLNEMILENDFYVEKGSNRTIQFSYTDGKISIDYYTLTKTTAEDGSETIKMDKVEQNSEGVAIRSTSSALSALGYVSENVINKDQAGTGEDQTYIDMEISFIGAGNEFSQGVIEKQKDENGEIVKDSEGNVTVTNKKTFDSSYISNSSMLAYLKGKSLTVTYGGESKSITLLTDEDYKKIQKVINPETEDTETVETIDDTESEGTGENTGETTPATKEEIVEDMLIKAINGQLATAFGNEKVVVSNKNENLVFESKGQLLTINSSSYEVRKNLGIAENASSKLTTSASLWDNREVLGFGAYGVTKGSTDEEIKAAKETFGNELAGFSINGVVIDGITADTTVDQLIQKINDTADTGVKASYLSGTGQFILVASETGTGRNIELSGAAKSIFGGEFTEGKDAIMAVSYGNGATTTVSSSTNTFNLDGLKVKVSGTFGYDGIGKDDDTKWISKLDSSKSVSFEAKSDVEGVTEQVKKFIEEYNALVDELYKQTSTRPDRDYGVLTEEQKDEMTDKEIENWEKKAKEGLLFGSSVVKELYSDVQNIVTQLMGNGISYSDLESIGITSSDTRADYGKLIFDESKFKEAMETDSKKVSDIFAGGGKVKRGLAQTMEDLFTPYATRYATKNGNSYGKLIEEAGSEKLILSVNDNFIYEQLKEMDEKIKMLQSRLKSEQDRYIKQFTSMESLISRYNTQSGYISGLSG
ncbi:MAG: flagellar filament capping protein FliD [Lachnospiraceae bacterium]|nr:flagellar filament capping protein FliD [Lachnospiraceae bacterium]